MRSMILACTKDGLIGKGRSLPWVLPDDLASFKQITTGHTVIFGYRTFEKSLRGRKLSDRHHIVIDRDKAGRVIDEVYRAHDLEDAFRVAQAWWPNEEHIVCGGAATYGAALPLVDRVYLSIIHERYEGNVYLPFTVRELWSEFPHIDSFNARDRYDFYTLGRAPEEGGKPPKRVQKVGHRHPRLPEQGGAPQDPRSCRLFGDEHLRDAGGGQ